MKKPYLKFILWVAVIVWMVLIFILSAQVADDSSALSGQTIRKITEIVLPATKNLPQEKQDKLIADLQYITRKTAHVLSYMVLGVLSMSALLQHSSKMKMWFISAIVICAFYAASDEFHQFFVEGRSAQFSDFLMDVAGAILGILLVMLIYWTRNRKRLKTL